MRLALIANPGSGKRTDPAAIRRRLEAAGADVVVCEAGWEDRTAATEQARGAERVVTAGGDGMVAPGAVLARDLGVPLAVVASGTANDFARDQGLPRDLDAACRLAARGTRTRPLELAAMDDHPFVNAASGGLSPVAAARAKPFKQVLGPLAYPAGALAAGVSGRPIDCRARIDGNEVFGAAAWQVIVAATGAFGAGAEIAEADPGDGLLDLVVVPAGSRAALPRRALAMRRGTLADEPGVIHGRGDLVELEVAPGTQFNVDGELVTAKGRRVRFTAERGAFELVTA